MRRQSYYEAIIQLRPSDEKVLDFIEKRVQERKDVSVSKIEQLKTGVDIYISSQRFARSLGYRLRRAFKGELKLSRKLFSVSKETGKRIYRVTILFRLKEQTL